VINGPPRFGHEAAETERAAIQGWGPTLRLLSLRAGRTAIRVISVVILNHTVGSAFVVFSHIYR
jgi:hypothetical protein